MKKYNLLKVMFIFLLGFMLLSWFIPAGVYESGTYTGEGIQAIGLFDLILLPFRFFNWDVMTKSLYTDGSIELISYSSIILTMLAIGLFYGVLNATGTYSRLVETVKEKVSKHSLYFLVGSSFIITLISALTGLNLVIMLFIPFIITVLLRLGYSKLNTMLATIGSMIVGGIGSLYAYNINGIGKIIYGVSINSGLANRLILFLISTIILLCYLVLTSKTDKPSEDIPLYKLNKKEQKSFVPLLVIVGIFTLLLSIFMYNWYYTFDITNITELYENIMSSSIGSYTIFKNIFGVMEPFGYWTGFTMSGILIIMSIIIAFVYSISLDKFIESAKSGIKKMLPVIFYMILAFVPIVVLAGNQSSFIYTIINSIMDVMGDLIIIPVTLISFIFSLFNVDFFALSSYTSLAFTTYDVANYPLITNILQVINGIVSLFTPASIFLVAGLRFLDIPYTKWLKYIWKLLLALLIICILIFIIISKL